MLTKLDYRRDFCSLHHTLVFSRVMLYKLYENLDKNDLKKLKFLFSDQLGRRTIELCNVRTKLLHHSHNPDIKNERLLLEI